MKKLFSLLLVIALAVASVFAFTSCANPNPEDTLVCGVTEIPGLNERDASGEWTIGFETEFAMAVAGVRSTMRLTPTLSTLSGTALPLMHPRRTAPQEILSLISPTAICSTSSV